MTTHKPSYRPRLEEKHKSIISTIRKMDSIALREANIHLNKCLDLGLFLDKTYGDIIKELKIHYDREIECENQIAITKVLDRELEYWIKKNKELDRKISFKYMFVDAIIAIAVTVPLTYLIMKIYA